MLTGFSWIEKGLMTSSCEHSNEHSSPIVDWEFLDYMSDCQLPSKDFAS